MEVQHSAQKLTDWTKETVLTGGCEGVVVGMSGGVDSSVLAVLCHRAFPQSTLGVIMPCFSSREDEEHARVVAGQFSITTKIVVLDTVYDSLLQALSGEKVENDVRRLAEANLKARLRMLTLHHFANQLEYMVAGSGNRSELAIGYFTKYGDGGVDFLPLGGLVKGQVRELAGFLGIPQPIIEKSPSAGLWHGQTDEDELGFSYEELDHYLLTGEASTVLREKIESMMVASEHKRMPPQAPDFQV
jgi:NAD+ synthase